MFKFSSVGYKCDPSSILRTFFFAPTRSLFLLLVLFFLEIFSCHGLIRSKITVALPPSQKFVREDQTRSRISCMSCWSLLVRRNMLRTRFALPIHQLSCSLWNSHGKYHKDTIFYSMENETNEKTYDSAHKYPFQGEVAPFVDQLLCLLSISFWISFFHYIAKFLFHQLHQKNLRRQTATSNVYGMLCTQARMEFQFQQ